MEKCIASILLVTVLQATILVQADPVVNYYLNTDTSTQDNETQPATPSKSSGTAAATSSGKINLTNFGGDVSPEWMKCASITGVQSLLPVVPGNGWDSLNSQNMAQAIALSYKQCKTTPDLQYVIPDSVTVVPLKESTVHQFSEVFRHFSDYTDILSGAMHLDVSYGKFSGSFDVGYQKNKKEQVTKKSSTTRTQIRHEFYKVEVKADSQLSQTLKNRLLNVGELMLSNMTAAAEYEMELIIRDFGTHVIRSTTAGGVFVQESQISNKFVEALESSDVTVEAAASFNFVAKVGFKFNFNLNKTVETQFSGNTTQSTTRTYGGPAYRPEMLVNEWEDGLPANLVTIDRSGSPIQELISEFTLPELPAPIVRRMAIDLDRIAQAYIDYNTHPGCLDTKSPNFDYQANLADTSLCTLAKNTYHLGGVYVTCSVQGTDTKHVCEGLQQKNPLTGDYSCPAGYGSVLLHTGTHNINYPNTKCQRLIYTCGYQNHQICSRRICNQNFQSATAIYQTHWCVRVGSQATSGYYFGGLYTYRRANPATGGESCPADYYALKMGFALRMCISTLSSATKATAVEFGGFFSCQAGNPLVFVDPGNPTPLDTLGFGKLTGSSAWPKTCPTGYVKHLAEVNNGCEMYYCVKVRSFASDSTILLHRPPYGRAYPQPSNSTIDTQSIQGPGGRAWYKNLTSGDWEKEVIARIEPERLDSTSELSIDSGLSGNSGLSSDSDDSSPIPNTGIIVAVVIVSLLVVIVIVAVLYIFIRHRHLRPGGHHHHGHDHHHGRHHHHGHHHHGHGDDQEGVVGNNAAAPDQ
eukprot:scpid30640/ scgid28397/ Macrophage-expressed gene 1 protein